MTYLDALALHRPTRRTMRLVQPKLQLRVASFVLSVTLGLAVLFVLNTYSAFGQLYAASLTWAPDELKTDLSAQTQSYLKVSLALSVAAAASLVGICIALVHRLIGPTVALERHVSALERGEYGRRVVLRRGEIVYATLAGRLNRLAETLERQELQRSLHTGSRRADRAPRAMAPPEIPLTLRA